MRMTTKNSAIAATILMMALSACSGANRGVDSGGAAAPAGGLENERPGNRVGGGTSIWDVLRRAPNENIVAVNKYIWAASLDVLNFLPIQTVDPFTGVIVTGYGTPPGGGRAYRATVYVSDPALEARSLKLSLQSRSGPVSGATQRAVEDAILARARQLRGRDSGF